MKYGARNPVDLTSVMTIDSLDDLGLKKGNQIRVLAKGAWRDKGPVNESPVLSTPPFRAVGDPRSATPRYSSALLSKT